MNGERDSRYLLRLCNARGMWLDPTPRNFRHQYFSNSFWVRMTSVLQHLHRPYLKSDYTLEGLW